MPAPRSWSDPGEEAERLIAAVEGAGVELEAILLTHCHFDHIGAVRRSPARPGAQVCCPEIETPILADIMAYVPWAGFGPYESYEPEHTVAGGEVLELAGMRSTSSSRPATAPAT